MNYHPWQYDDDEDFAVIERSPAEIEDREWRLAKGMPCKDWFPENVVFDLDPNWGIKLGDAIPNTLLLHIVSEKLKKIIEAVSNDVEFFLVKIRNARGKMLKKRYYVANVITTINCLDKDKSHYTKSCLDESQAHTITRLELDQDKIPEGTQLFRLGELTELLLVAEPLATAIAVDNECTGVIMTYIEDYGEEFRS